MNKEHYLPLGNSNNPNLSYEFSNEFGIFEPHYIGKIRSNNNEKN
ncbi:MAG: hypothetical protein ACK5HL_03340 [Bacilli bacterium]